jgi:hypothetical protein
MSIAYKWSVDKMQVAEDNLVVKVEWRVTATEDDLTASAAGVKSLARGDSFIPYEQLTEQQVLDWCFEPEAIKHTDREGNETTTFSLLKDEGEALVASHIALQLAKKQSEPALPWSQIPA